ncbi:hypothetical protein AX14_003056 [Amanita brunnescens Koide BX004]|nr:hypothetical protein AX14_003056 [Amanita brunnescens Koide BX004]
MFIPVFGGTVAFLTQAMYAYRIRVLGKLKYVPWCIMALIVFELLAVLVMSPFMNYSDILILGWASASLAIDIIITGAMIWSLRKNIILSTQLKSKVTHLVRLMIGTGALTVAINLLTVLLLVLKGNAALGPAIVLSKLYANSMMVFVNDRIPSSHGRHGHALSNTVTVPLTLLHFATVVGEEATTQEQPAQEGDCDDENSSTSRQMISPTNAVVLHEEGR